MRDVVQRQVEVGIDVVSDGEMSKPSYATYIAERASGFEGQAAPAPPVETSQKKLPPVDFGDFGKADAENPAAEMEDAFGDEEAPF